MKRVRNHCEAYMWLSTPHSTKWFQRSGSWTSRSRSNWYRRSCSCSKHSRNMSRSPRSCITFKLKNRFFYFILRQNENSVQFHVIHTFKTTKLYKVLFNIFDRKFTILLNIWIFQFTLTKTPNACSSGICNNKAAIRNDWPWKDKLPILSVLLSLQ